MRSLFLISMMTAWVHGAEPIALDRGVSGLLQSLRRLATTARVMHITAHPDDEDGPAITYLSRGLGAETTLLILNRGESGANLVTGDFFEHLGALRTAEILQAAQYYGVDVRFTRVVDYGYSKNVAETFRNWSREEALGDVVREIRRQKPHVIVSRWRGSARDGHGNHEAAGVLAAEAFRAAGDPKRFPEHAAEGLGPWQASKLYSGNRRENEDWTVRVDGGKYDALLGMSYAQLALEGLRFQKSQGAGAGGVRFGYSYYKLLDSTVGLADKEAGFFDRLDVGLRAFPKFESAVAAAGQAFRPDDVMAVVEPLTSALAVAPPGKAVQVRQALDQVTGVALEARVRETFSVATPNQTFHVALNLAGAEAERVELIAPDGWLVKQIEPGVFSVTVASAPKYTRAYWHRASVRESKYVMDEPALQGAPLPPFPLLARAAYKLRGVAMVAERPVAVMVGPPVGVAFATQAGALPVGRSRYPVTVRLRNQVLGHASGQLKLRVPAGWRTEPATVAFVFENQNEEAAVSFVAVAPAGTAAGDYAISAVAEYEGREFQESFHEVSYGALDRVFLSAPAVHQVRVVDAKIAPGLRVGYVMGTGDDVPEGLKQLGVAVDLLDKEALATGDLGKYSTIFLGIRAYAARTDVKTYNARLLDYVARGGVLVVQYNTPEYDNNYGPYPYVMGRNPEEVSEEDSVVKILQPGAQVFNWPNKIAAGDFAGWVEQRGSKFWGSWDSHYTALLETADTGQAPQRGGWLEARHGQGLYVYCAYAWYRQIPYSVPGAVRLFANLVSLGSLQSSWRKLTQP